MENIEWFQLCEVHKAVKVIDIKQLPAPRDREKLEFIL